MPNQKKRTAWSVQDVVEGKPNTSGANPRFKSGYSGPKKSSSAVMDRVDPDGSRRSSYQGTKRPTQGAPRDTGYMPRVDSTTVSAGGYGILDYAWIVYSAILGLCVLLSVIMFKVNGSKVDGYRYPSYIFSFNGVLNQIYDDYAHGGLGSNYKEPTNEEKEIDTSALLGETTNTSSLPNTTTGATMAIDNGSATYGTYTKANSHSELVGQVQQALEANDFGFIGMKFVYEDESTGDLIGYPQSVVEHFTSYMSDNIGKREIFLTEIGKEEYSTKNGSAYLVKLPILKFTINMGYDNTNVSISGFSDQKMESGQSAVVSPLLPCMYTITVTTDDGSQSSEVECDMSEGNLQINIGVTN